MILDTELDSTARQESVCLTIAARWGGTINPRSGLPDICTLIRSKVVHAPVRRSKDGRKSVSGASVERPSQKREKPGMRGSVDGVWVGY